MINKKDKSINSISLSDNWKKNMNNEDKLIKSISLSDNWKKNMINEDESLNLIYKKNEESIYKKNEKFHLGKIEIDSKKWIDTKPSKNRYYSITKYSSVLVLFVASLLIISVVKNQTRKLEKDINVLTVSNDKIQFSLKQAILDYEVLSSPENLTLLASKHLNSSLVVYKKSQIKSLNDKNEETIPNKNLSNDIKKKVNKKIKNTKVEIAKLKKLYSTPEAIPQELKSTIARRIDSKKTELKNLYNSYDSPTQMLTSPKVQKWASIQLVKLFLGFPAFPGK
jgi:hypothetical protein